MKQQDFENKYQSGWAEFREMLDDEKRSDARRSLPEHYQVLCHHLALAKQRRYSSSLIAFLNDLVIDGHNQVYGPLPRFKASFLYYLIYGFPQAIRDNKVFVIIAFALFFIPGFVFFALCLSSNDLIYSLMDVEQVRNFEQMYEPSAKAFGRERESDTDIAMFGFYIYNNIGISFQTFASGVFYGVGSVFFLVYNGIFIGAAAGHISQVGYTETFFPFVVGHGSFELTAIALAGAAGLKLGWALISPGRFTRLSALQLASKDAIVLIYGTTVMLLIAAFIEAFWSSSSTLVNEIKYSVGAVLWVLVYYYLFLFGRPRAVK